MKSIHIHYHNDHNTLCGSSEPGDKLSFANSDSSSFKLMLNVKLVEKSFTVETKWKKILKVKEFLIQ